MATVSGPEPRSADDYEKEVLRRQLEGLPRETSPPTIFAYVQSFDIVLIIISTASSIIAGALNPLLTVIYGLLVRSFQNFANNSVSGPELSAHVSQFTLYYVYLGIAEFVFIYIATVGFYHAGERITRNLRRAYLKAIIRQNIAFFDNLNAGEVTTRITSDMNRIQEGITSKISVSLTAGATFVAAVIISFIEYWKLALILLSTVVAIGGAEFLGAKFAVKYSKESFRSYSSGAAIAEEAISSIRHVSAYGIQKAMADRYLSHMRDAERSGIKTRLSVAFMIAVMNAVPYLSYGLAFWQGSRYVVTGEMTASGVVTTTMAIIIGSFAVGRVAPNAESFISSIASAGTVLEAMARRSPQDPFSNDGTRLDCVHGDIQLKDVSLVYPSRPDVQVLNKVNIHFPANQTTAIVGASGCGKSSIIGLIERFYQPTQGEVGMFGCLCFFP
jgi:ATP-binding cassette subfamily B (MDR/TAP) protein 1